MFGATKAMYSERLYNGQFIETEDFKARFEPKKFNSFREQETKENHITFRMFCLPQDLAPSDRVWFGDRSFIIGGVYEYNDTFGPHQEILMREQNTRLHETVNIKTLNATQDNYDELLGEWVGNKNHSNTYVQVLMDSAKLMKTSFIKMIGAGKMENTEWIMTVDYPQRVRKEDKVVYQGETFEVKWIVPFPDKLLVGLYKHIKNYE